MINGEASHNVLDERLGEGDTVEVLHVVKLLDDFQIGLKGLDLGSQIFGNFFNKPPSPQDYFLHFIIQETFIINQTFFGKIK